MAPPKARKLLVMGFRAVGKSSLTIQFVENQFVDSYDPTIENTFQKQLKYNGQVYDLMIVDTAGQDEYSIFPQSYCMDIHGYIFVYSINNAKSFEVCKVIHDKLMDLVGQVQVPIVLVGNKSDLGSIERVIDESEGKKTAETWNASFIEASAKIPESAKDVFTAAIQEIEKAEGVNQTDSKCRLS